ncbi:MAG: ASPIC/UnbV domain-containing protein [Verrucomicrobiales bacterium]
MRTDDKLSRETFRKSDEWTKNAVKGESQPGIDLRLAGDELVDGRTIVHSLSGNERNHFFANLDSGKDFEDLSALSGLDNPADSRGFVIFDYDHDGWQDVAMVNANRSLMNLYHNDIGKIPGVANAGMIAVRFVGGSTKAEPSAFACRDGYGAIVRVALDGDVTLTREHRCGEGYAAQNSSTMVIGIGERSEAASVTVRWPSGEEFSIENVEEGTLITAYENRVGGAFTQQPYRNVRTSGPAIIAKTKFPVSKITSDKVQVYTTTATWCAACIGHIPALRHLKEDGIALYGVPIDVEDDAAKLATYVEKKKPPYTMLAELGAAEKEAVTAYFSNALQSRDLVLPTSVITDGEGNVLEVMQGIPTLSQVRKWRGK